MKFQITNSSVVKLFWMIFMLIFEVLRNGEVVWRELVSKVAKRRNSGQIPEPVPVQVRVVPVQGNRMQPVPV